MKALEDLAALITQVFAVPICHFTFSDLINTSGLLSIGLASTETAQLNPAIQRVLDKGLVIAIEDIDQDSNFEESELPASDLKLASFLGCRLLDEWGEDLGTLSLFSQLPRSFTESDKTLLKGFATQASHLLSNMTKAEVPAQVEFADLFRQVMSKGRAQLCIHNIEGQILYVNQSASESLGYTAEVLLGMSLTDLMTEENKPGFDLYIKRMQATGLLDGIIELIDRSGHKRYWSYNNALDQVSGKVISFSLDITNTVNERRRISNREEAVKKARQLAEKGTWTIDLLSKELEWSKEVRRIFELDSSTQISLDHYLSLIHPKDRDDFEQALQEAIDTHGNVLAEHRFIAADKSIKYLSVTGQAHKNLLGNAPYLTGVIQDITHRVAWEKELLRGKESAVELSELKQEFLANMSHEIRTPVSSIIGFSRLLLSAQLPVQERKYAELIFSAGENLLTIVNDVLDFSKMEAGKLRLEEKPYDLRTCLQELIQAHQDQAQNKGIRLLLDLQSSIPQLVQGDELRVKQIVSNLLSNALKFTRSGFIEVGASRVGRGSEGKLRIKVSDSGIGIDASKLSKIFNSFQQAEGSHTRKYGGTGLGLSITKDLVELMQGNIEVESNLGQGSTFTVLLPYIKVSPKQDIPAGQTTSSKFDFSAYRILMAEDNSNNQLLAKAYMRRVKAHLDIANDGIEALELLEQNTYDLVLMDIQMPRMGGIECARKIRANAQWNHIPIVAITAHATPEDRERSLNAGMSEHLTKPFKPEILYQTIATLVGNNEKRESEEPGNRTAFDLSYLLNYSMNDKTLYQNLLTTLSNTLPKNIHGIEQGLHQGDLSSIQDFTHKVKPSIIMFEEERSIAAISNIEKSHELGTETSETVMSFLAQLHDLLNTIKQDLSSN